MSAADPPKVTNPIKTVRGDNYLIVPWRKTELQNWLIGSSGKTKEDYKAFVAIDGNSLYTKNGKLGDEAIDWRQLTRQLRPLADRDRGIVEFSVYNFSIETSADRVLGWALKGFGEQRAGFKTAYVAQSMRGKGKFWDIIDAATKTMAGREEGDELAVGNELVQVYPVQTFLSCLASGNADCVVRIVPRLNKNTGKALPPEIHQAILQTVPKVTTARREKVVFLINYTKDAKATVDWFRKQGADDLARELGFQDSGWSAGEY